MRGPKPPKNAGWFYFADLINGRFCVVLHNPGYPDSIEQDFMPDYTAAQSMAWHGNVHGHMPEGPFDFLKPRPEDNAILSA